MSIISSPSTVLSNCLNGNTLNILRPRIEINQPEEIVFSVGTQMNGVPHIGTYIVQCASFIIAKQVQDMFRIKTRVEFGILDNCDALGKKELRKFVDLHYTSYFDNLQELTGISYVPLLYSDIQESPIFRKHFLKTLRFVEKVKWCVSPSNGNLCLCIPCPKCQKYAENVELLHFDGELAVFQCVCLNHSLYEVKIGIANQP